MRTPSEFLQQYFPFEPTPGQKALFKDLDEFILGKAERSTFLLRGYAGTGKTTVVSSIIKMAPKFGYNTQMMAPTGRAAKVMSTYAGRKAFTIHKGIYRQISDPTTGSVRFRRDRNYLKKTIFIIDEASMISDERDGGDFGLLQDLINYVFEDESNRLLLVGDAAQLPPVKQTRSPALDMDFMARQYNLHVRERELTEVVRQEEASGILFNATELRKLLKNNQLDVKFRTKGYRDTFKMTGEKLEDGLHYSYNKWGMENTIIIVRSNKQATLYNKFIRQQILFRENEIEAGDLLMIVRNNYTCLGEDSAAGFLANGDFVEVLRVGNFEEMHGFRFATLRLRLTDYPEQEPFESKVFLDTLHSFTPALSAEENEKLYEAVSLDYEDVSPRTDRLKQIKVDPYLNALQVKFAYTLTCHKSQGGQWSAVFVDQGFLKDDMLNQEYLRWLYTGITRATEELFLMNFDEKFYAV
jgi:ATP-dependent exoDNAse (exonuclease V) alpha subunit